MLRRHDLVQVELAAWDAMLRCHPALLDLPLVPDWARRGWPVIVRRRMLGDSSTTFRRRCLATLSWQATTRIQLLFRRGGDRVAAGVLRDAAGSAPVKWQPIIAALLDLGEAVRDNAARVRRPALAAHDRFALLDRSIGLGSALVDFRRAGAHSLVEGLRQLDANSPVRLDGELQLPDGAGVNWRELAQNCDDELPGAGQDDGWRRGPDQGRTVPHAGLTVVTAALQQVTHPMPRWVAGYVAAWRSRRIAGRVRDLAQAGPREPCGFRQSHRHGREHVQSQRDGYRAVLLSADRRGCGGFRHGQVARYWGGGGARDAGRDRGRQYASWRDLRSGPALRRRRRHLVRVGAHSVALARQTSGRNRAPAMGTCDLARTNPAA